MFGAFADDRIDRDVLLRHLLMLDEGNWGEFRGEHGTQAPKPLTSAAMVKMVSNFGIRTRNIWPRHRTANSQSSRGYYQADFEPAFADYLDNATAPQPSNVKHLR